MLHKLLEQLFQELSLDTVPLLDERQEYHFKTSSSDIALKESDSNVFLSAHIGPMPENKPEEFLLHVMKANFLGQGTGGGAIGLTEDESCLTLSLSLPYEMNYRTFKESLEDFANFLDYWRQEIVQHDLKSRETIK